MLGPVHKTPEEFENALRLKHTVHTNPSRKQSFSKQCSSNWRNLKTPVPLRFRVNTKHFVNGVFLQTMASQ